MIELDIPRPKYTYDDKWSDNRGQSERYYHISDWDPMPSVTTVLDMISKPPLKAWFQKISLKKLEEIALATPWPEKPQRNENKNNKLEDPNVYDRRIDRIWKRTVIGALKDARQEPIRLRNTAADHGTRAHQAIHYVGNGGSVEDLEEEVVGTALAYQEWIRQANIKILHQEIMVWHPSYNYAGTIDAVGVTHDNKLVVVDWKTGSGIYSESALQVSAYAAALSQITSQPVDECWVVRIPKQSPDDPKVLEQKQVADWEHTFQSGFLPALYLWQTYHQPIWA